MFAPFFFPEYQKTTAIPQKYREFVVKLKEIKPLVVEFMLEFFFRKKKIIRYPNTPELLI